MYKISFWRLESLQVDYNQNKKKEKIFNINPYRSPKGTVQNRLGRP